MGAFFTGLAAMLVLLAVTGVSVGQLQSDFGQHNRPSGVRLHAPPAK